MEQKSLVEFMSEKKADEFHSTAVEFDESTNSSILHTIEEALEKQGLKIVQYIGKYYEPSYVRIEKID